MLHLFPYLLFISALLLYNCNWPASGPRIISYRLWVQQTVWGGFGGSPRLSAAHLLPETDFVGIWHWPRAEAVPTGTGDRGWGFWTSTTFMWWQSSKSWAGPTAKVLWATKWESLPCLSSMQMQNVVVAASPQMLGEAMIFESWSRGSGIVQAVHATGYEMHS